MLEVVESWWHLTLTVDLDSYFRILSAQAILLKWLDLGTSFSVWGCIFKTSRSRCSFQGHGLRSNHGSKKQPRAGLRFPQTQFNIHRVRREVLWRWVYQHSSCVVCSLPTTSSTCAISNRITYNVHLFFNRMTHKILNSIDSYFVTWAITTK